MKKYIVYTTVFGKNYFICSKNGEVSEIAKFDKERADEIAKRNSNKDITYKVEEITIEEKLIKV